ncbi:MAG: HAMP domain-containing protein [Synechococcales cyanobacterium M58_A2018_015]|nr:HAMP domain-containing protein [Synechococcales cyanobacterium M58_A2018_015]
MARNWLRRHSIFRQTRTRIWIWYVGLILLFLGSALPIIYHALSRQISDRLREEVVAEVIEFREELALELTDPSQLRAWLLDYLANEPTEEDQYFIAIFNGQFLGASPAKLPAAMQPGSPLMAEWQRLEQPTYGEQDVDDPNVVRILYYAEPIVIAGQVQGVFLTAYITADEYQEVQEAMRTMISIKLLILLVASLVAWWVCGRLLRPLRTLAMAARSISETDLSRRLTVEGNDELAEMARTFNDMMDRLQQAFVHQKDFVSDISHELRTPITVIQGHLELMGDDPEEQREALAVVSDELGRMMRFVNDLLLLARADQHDFIQPEVVELQPFLEELYAKAKVLAECDCQLDLRIQEPLTLMLDRQRMTQAVLNLVSNAVRHTPSDGQITLGALIEPAISPEGPDLLKLWVRDTGEGIAPADQQRIFERFARAASGQRLAEGTGLGLAIVQAIVTASGGRIELVSRVGQGSTFTLVLPVVRPSAEGPNVSNPPTASSVLEPGA